MYIWKDGVGIILILIVAPCWSFATFALEPYCTSLTTLHIANHTAYPLILLHIPNHTIHSLTITTLDIP